MRARRLSPSDRGPARELLLRAPVENLVLIDFVERLGRGPGPGEMQPHLLGAFRGEHLEAIAALRPSIAVSTPTSDAALEILLPHFRRVSSGLVKSPRRVVEPIWKTLEGAGRRAIIDRIELAYRLAPDAILPAAPGLPGVARPARREDLSELVYAARASLWEEDRPDPADGDPTGFRRWVEGRLPRARIVSDAGRTVFVAYVDVRRSEGWLVQGVYTWPDVRRRGFARRGMDSVIREAFAEGADHVQLAVVEGNERASKLYENLGFEVYGELRTVLFR